MDYQEILFCLTIADKTENEEIKDFDNRLQQILQQVRPMLTDDDKKFIMKNIENENEPLDIRYEYICTVICVLQNMKPSNSMKDESLFSVKQFRTLKICIELITALGIIPCLLPGVGIDMAKLCPRASLICEEKLTDLQKYKRLQFTVNSLIQLYDEIMFRPAIIAQIGPLLTALLQLCHAPLMKPSTKSISVEQETTSKNKFIMTSNLYDKLKKDQEHFMCLFHELLSNCPMSVTMKQLMVILGIKGAPKWLQRETRKYLVQELMHPNGIVSIVAAICENILDFGEHWDKLDIISRLISTSHGNNPDDYYKSICSQLLNLLVSTEMKHSATIANCCITALYEYNPNVCLNNVMEVMYEPLLVNLKNEQQENLKHEDSFIYLAAINGLCAIATSYPEIVIEVLVQEYIDMPQRVSAGEITTETRIKLGEILVKVTRALGELTPAYKNILINGFLCATRDPDSLVRASSLSCLGELCKVLGFRLGDAIIEVIYCISCIIKTDKASECRRAAVMVSTLLLRGLGKDTLTSLGKDLVSLYRGLKYLRDNDGDAVLRLHAQLALEELDNIVRDYLSSPSKLEKRIFLLDSL